MTSQCDIFISGGGIAGLTAAAVLGSAGLRVVCADPGPMAAGADAPDADLRTTALLQPARALLEDAGVWPHLQEAACPLWVMQIMDAGQSDTKDPAARRAFEATDVSDAPFGWNIPNWRIKAGLLARLGALDTVTLRPGTKAEDLITRQDTAHLRLSGGGTLRARLAVAADGRNSALRRAAGIGVRTRRYGQKALSFAVTHPVPHDNISTEIHQQGGPFTFVPLPDQSGQPCSAVVWMDDGPTSLARLHAPEADFEAEATARSLALLGPLRLASPRAIWPIISQQATRLTCERLALVAEAAHVVPPIGAQGLNMSLADIRTLRDLAVSDPEGLGGPAMLAAYSRARQGDITMRVAGIDLLNRTSQTGNPLLRGARARGVDALHQIAPVRRALMRLGLGISGRHGT